ncbi:hypothetical protein [Montanilutibacter psychrotolerans]|uniref:Uncharacterized protein n=1 Tax=Montanilutibacter psychrotolerans TaxID=1327343 RepID=A0A3M8SYL5_9GAMM|nr:hypothetical protein [Lysobacter psychrotolerans]RNF86329.1 hypothetical protein EER27_02610 [Lysobacter psychrotolerans]
MWNLFKAELLRFRGWAIALGGVHLLVLAFMTRVVDLGQQPLLVHRSIGGVYVLVGLLLGLYQMGGYRRPNAWLNLLHRPVSSGKIAAALFGAGMVLLVLAVALPILTIAGYQEAMTARVVDVRHWLLPLAAMLLASCGYLAGGYCMLGGRRYSSCALVMLALPLVSTATGTAALAMQALVMLWLACMVLAAFKPDLSAPPRSPAATIVAALPLQMSLYLLILLLGFGVELLWIMQGSHPRNRPTPPIGGAIETERFEDKALLLAGLANSKRSDAALLREQVALSETYGIGVQVPRLPLHDELTNVAPMEFDDSERRVRWVFSHDSMRFEGYSLVNGRGVGSLGVGAAGAAFPTTVLPVGDAPSLPKGSSALIGRRTLYVYDSELGQVLPRIELPANEVVAGAGQVGDRLGVVSDRAVYFFDGRDVIENDHLLVPRLRVPIPGQYGDLGRVEMIELLDGYLISFAFFVESYRPTGATPYQHVLRVHEDGRIETAARRAIAYDNNAFYRYESWWPSPAMYALRMGAGSLFADPDPLLTHATPPIPRGMWRLAGVLSLLSLLAAVWLTRNRPLSPTARVGWIAACGLIGVPALLSLWLLFPERERVGDLRTTHPVDAHTAGPQTATA